jgi:hypothetical protein
VPYRKNNKAVVTEERIRIKSGHGPQRGRLTIGRKINSTQIQIGRYGEQKILVPVVNRKHGVQSLSPFAGNIYK